MPDYTSILRRSISALPEPSPEMREAVYQRARAALARQLTAVDPPLSTREIEAQHQELEDAVARLEADFAPDEVSQPDPIDDDPGEEDFYDPEPRGGRADYEDSPPGLIEPHSVAAAPGGDYDGADEDDEEEFEEEEERSSRAPLLVGLLLLILFVVGVGAYGYARRDAIAGFFGGGDDTDAVVTIEPPTVAAPEPEPAPDPVAEPALEPEGQLDRAAAESAPDKRPDRLANGTEPPPVTAPDPADVAAADPVSPPDLPMEGEAPIEPLPAETAPGLQEPNVAALNPSSGSIVAQRAIYYFQGAEGSPGQATEGTVAWAEITRDTGPAIQATLRLAERDVTTTVTIYKNSDPSLPASHLVEVQFGGALGGSPVQRVPALVMKQTEQARGQPLTGAAVPVTDNLFWIALSDDADQVTQNLQLLREGSWFDIPILFTDGTRALLTFEKGIPGDKVFETVMSGWTPT